MIGAAVARTFAFRVGGYRNKGNSTVGFKHDGRRIHKLMSLVDKDSRSSAMRATNRVGNWASTKIIKNLAELLNVKAVRTARKATKKTLAYPKQSRPEFVLKIYTNHINVKKLKYTKFHRGKKRKDVGTLTLNTYFKQQILRPVLRIKDKFYLLKRGRRPRYIHGAFTKRGYREPQNVKEEIPGRWLEEFNRQMALKKKSRRSRRR